MFNFHCPECGKNQLIFPGQISRLVNDEDGIEVAFTCWCGLAGTFRTGKSAARSESLVEHALAS